MKASILAVGTELTTGQIVNRNASWISERLKSRGLLTELHLTVPDDRALMLESMRFCASHADLVFITGGLGPTSDDFTRNVVAEWTGLSLEFDHESWQYINDRLGSRGYKVTDIQKQQCYFPRGAQILKNSQGTAHGFKLGFGKKTIYVLPGPPKEIEAIWNELIENDILKLTENIDRHLTLSWDTMGLGESQIAERIENVVGTDSKYEIGYRVHLPYVEVKFSFLESQVADAKTYSDQIDSILTDCTVLKNGEDVVTYLISYMKKFDHVEIYDNATGGILASRFLPALKHLSSWKMVSGQIASKRTLEDKVVRLSVEKVSESEVCAIIRTSQFEQKEKLSSQLNSLMNERKLQLFTERSLIFWSLQLKNRK